MENLGEEKIGLGPGLLIAQVESLTRAVPELVELTKDHYGELSLHKTQGFDLAPIWDVYRLREARGEVLFVGLRAEGKLVGYICGFIGPGLHYSGCLTCTPDVFFIHPGWRGSSSGALKLFRAAEKELKRRGVGLWQVGVKKDTQAGRLLGALGFSPVDVIHYKWLGGEKNGSKRRG